jgi:flagellar L-ring protein FlgH
MKRILFIGCLLVAAAVSSHAQDFRTNAGRSLFSDQKAARPGDAVTVLVVESMSATNDAKTSASRKSGLSLSVASGTNSPSGGTVGTGNEFDGAGSTESKGTFQAKISALVDSVLPNGNLLIHGRRKTVINGEEQMLTLKGIVRPSDVRADNSVYSFNVSEAEIVMEGNGTVSRVQGPGWITKFFHWLL